MTAIPNMRIPVARGLALLRPTVIASTFGRLFSSSGREVNKVPYARRSASYYESGLAGRERFRL